MKKNFTTPEIVALVAAVLLVVAPFLAGVKVSAFGVSETANVFGTSAFGSILSIIAAVVLAGVVFVKSEVYAKYSVGGKPVTKGMIIAVAAVVAVLAFLLVVTSNSATKEGETLTKEQLALIGGTMTKAIGTWVVLIGAVAAGAAAYLEMKKK